MKNGLVIIIATFFFAAGFGSDPVFHKIHLSIVSQSVREPIPDAFVVFTDETGGITNAATGPDGRLDISLAEGSYKVSVSSMYYHKSERQIDLKSDVETTVPLLLKREYRLADIDVVAKKKAVSGPQVILDRQELTDHPIGITADPLGSLNRYAGIDQTSVFAYGNPSRISVRGGTGLENRIEFEEFQILNPWHRIIPDSVFLFDMVRDVSVEKSGLPAETSQALSSLLRLRMNESPDGFHGQIMSSLINTSLVLQGKNSPGWSWNAGIRRTHYDLVMNLFSRPNEATDIRVPYYVDSQGRIRYSDESDQLKLFWNYSLEPVKIYVSGTSNDLAGTFGLPSDLLAKGQAFFQDVQIGTEWKRILSKDSFMVHRLEWIYGEEFVGYRFAWEDNTGSSMSRATMQNRLAYSGIWSWNILDKFLLTSGLVGELAPDVRLSNRVTLVNQSDYSPIPEMTNIMDNTFTGNWAHLGGHISIESRWWDRRLGIRAGLRIDRFTPAVDISIDPRLLLDFVMVTNHRLYFSLEKLSSFPLDSWNFSLLDMKSDLFAESCVQWSTGYEFLFTIPGISGKLEGYYKEYTNLPTPVSNFILSLRTEGDAKVVAGYDIGLDFRPPGLPIRAGFQAGGVLIREYAGIGDYPDAILAYSPDGITLDQELINDMGHPEVFSWCTAKNPRLKLDAQAVWEFLPGFSLTAEFFWREGERYTPVILFESRMKTVSNYFGGETEIRVPKLGEYLSEKYEDDHRLDLQLAWKGEWLGLSTGCFLTVNNVYDHRPVLRWQFDEYYSIRTAVRSPLGIYGTFGFWFGW